MIGVVIVAVSHDAQIRQSSRQPAERCAVADVTASQHVAERRPKTYANLRHFGALLQSRVVWYVNSNITPDHPRNNILLHNIYYRQIEFYLNSPNKTLAKWNALKRVFHSRIIKTRR